MRYVLFLLVACTSAEADRLRLRDQARVVLERHCGNCHVPESPAAMRRALDVYDLREVEWSRRMTNAQLEALSRRIREGEFFDEFDARNHGKTPPPAPSEEEQAQVRSYVRAELARRQAQLSPH